MIISTQSKRSHLKSNSQTVETLKKTYENYSKNSPKNLSEFNYFLVYTLAISETQQCEREKQKDTRILYLAPISYFRDTLLPFFGYHKILFKFNLTKIL